LVRLPQDRFVPAWSYPACSRFRDLPEEQKEPLHRIAGELFAESEKAWEDQGRTILRMMRETTEMLPCAEDLGAIPDCVPGVLQELRILGLRIPRWARRWHEEGQPYIPVTEYPFLSVCAPSVHDTSTMRGWWYETDDRQAFWESLGLPGSAPPDYDADTARLVVEALLETSSALCVLQYQDLLALAPERDPGSPEDERVNVPGTMSEFNWGYRMPQPISQLVANRELEAVIGPLLHDRRRRSMSGL
jgi:4-alpha-glucanotransferase